MGAVARTTGAAACSMQLPLRQLRQRAGAWPRDQQRAGCQAAESATLACNICRSCTLSIRGLRGKLPMPVEAALVNRPPPPCCAAGLQHAAGHAAQPASTAAQLWRHSHHDLELADRHHLPRAGKPHWCGRGSAPGSSCGQACAPGIPALLRALAVRLPGGSKMPLHCPRQDAPPVLVGRRQSLLTRWLGTRFSAACRLRLCSMLATRAFPPPPCLPARSPACAQFQ